MTLKREAFLDYKGPGADNTEVTMLFQTMSLTGHKIFTQELTEEERTTINDAFGAAFQRIVDILHTAHKRTRG